MTCSQGSPRRATLGWMISIPLGLAEDTGGLAARRWRASLTCDSARSVRLPGSPASNHICPIVPVRCVTTVVRKSINTAPSSIGTTAAVRIPTGFHQSAQGWCEARAPTLGSPPKNHQPQRGCITSTRRRRGGEIRRRCESARLSPDDSTLSGLRRVVVAVPKVARSGQPWAG